MFKRIKILAGGRIESGYANGHFDVVVPFNPRELGGVAAFRVPAVLLLAAAVAVVPTWWAFEVGFATLFLMVAALTLLESTYTELPRNELASAWQHEHYGFATRCGVWRPLNTVIYFGLRSPTYFALGLFAWKLVGLYQGG